MLKKFFSYVFPITIFKTKSNISKSIEVTWANGELLIDSENTNYSYGSLQRILRIGLKQIGFSSIQSMNNILVLGVAGGSVIKTLVNEVGYKGKIKGVDIDPEIIEVANTYFQLNTIPNTEIVIQDAFEYVLRCKDHYDLVIIDVFQDKEMPNFLFEHFFINHTLSLLNSNGFVLFNTMLLKEADNKRNKNFIQQLDAKLYKINAIPKIESHNELILIQKKP
ncbi:spermidine synthase [Flavobacterium sp. LM5]|uniref:spermidine synthase n=1 Tax=Flavobacterium sp. LM5 TaxID=1938610 RepID=UPI00099397F0|nr:methyltransferase domain-containing protein [Flavobacterium sp. LM5]OOV26418.1 spermidine synthase [Flavobacterium sp. LM5]